MTISQLRRCTVHHRGGDSRVAFEPPARHAHRRAQRTGAELISLQEIMSSELICARADLELSQVVWLLIHHRLGCIPVVDERRHPIGMITKFDIVANFDAAMQSVDDGSRPTPASLTPRVADDVMMPLALVLDEHATVAHAAALMVFEDTHHVLVTREPGELVGVVTSKDIVKWLVDNDGLLPTR